MLACRRQLIDDITARKQQLEHLQSERPRAMVVEMIENLTNQNKEMDKAIDAHVKAHDDMQATVELLTMRGCGRILALTLIIGLRELGQLDRRRVAAPCGAVGSPQPHAASASQPSPKTAACAKTGASPKVAEARSAGCSKWPPSAPWSGTTSRGMRSTTPDKTTVAEQTDCRTRPAFYPL